MKIDKIENTTPHEVVLLRLDWRKFDSPKQATIAKWPAAETPLRLPESDLYVSKLWIPNDALKRGMWHESNWETENYTAEMSVVYRRFASETLPPQEDGKLYIVSLPVAMAAPRGDLIAPDTGPGLYGAARDGGGNIVGVQRFCTFENPRNLGNWHGTAEEWEAAQSLTS